MNLRFLSSIRVLFILTSDSISSRKLYGFSTNSILLDSILLISKILPTISSNVSEAFRISLESSTTSCGTCPSYDSISSDKPTIAFNGVLISCDILDKKSDLALLAFSA